MARIDSLNHVIDGQIKGQCHLRVCPFILCYFY
jgi:hypothetical protein